MTTTMQGQIHGMWASVATAWEANADFIDARGAALTERLLDLARPAPGERVLELASGPGGLGLAAAGRVGPEGEVVISDVAAPMVAAARARARARGLDNVRARELDFEAIEEPDESFDVVLCREGLMFAIDPARAAAEARRVLRPGGLLVVWTYGRQRVDSGPVDELLNDFYDRVIGSWWAPERRWVETGYQTLRFPFEETAIAAPPMIAEWNLGQLLGYIGTWSAVARCREETGSDPLAELAGRLVPLWGDPSAPRDIEWPLSVRAGR